MNKKRVLVAMSGGVDSSVAAALLVKEGYEAIAVTMRLWEEADEQASNRPCCAFDSVRDARLVADKLGIPHYTLNLKDKFRHYVVDNFMVEYASGHTPNPCIRCNQHLKFDALLTKAKELECHYIATGHYATVEEKEGYFQLKKALNKEKDQSYVLYHLNQKNLPHILFPLANFTNKDDLRKLAASLELPVANKPESQDICFIPDNNTREFLIRQNPALQKPGDILLANSGQILGQHKGIAFYTIGQRKGLGMSWPKPLYIVEIDHLCNRLIVGTNEHVFKSTLTAKELSFVQKPLTAGQTREITAKIRYAHKEAPATLSMIDEHTAKVFFKDPQRAVTPGQAVVFYEGDNVLGGGIIW